MCVCGEATFPWRDQLQESELIDAVNLLVHHPWMLKKMPECKEFQSFAEDILSAIRVLVDDDVDPPPSLVWDTDTMDRFTVELAALRLGMHLQSSESFAYTGDIDFVALEPKLKLVVKRIGQAALKKALRPIPVDSFD